MDIPAGICLDQLAEYVTRQGNPGLGVNPVPFMQQYRSDRRGVEKRGTVGRNAISVYRADLPHARDGVAHRLLCPPSCFRFQSVGVDLSSPG
jgi:hypothetical protein